MTTANEIKEMVSSNSKEKSFFKKSEVKAALKEMGLTIKSATENKRFFFDEDLRNQMADILNSNGSTTPVESDYEKAAKWAAKKFNQDLEHVKSAMFELKDEATYKGWSDFQTAAAAAKLVEKSMNL